MRNLPVILFCLLAMIPFGLQAAGGSSSSSSDSDESAKSHGYSDTSKSMSAAQTYIAAEQFEKAVAELQKEVVRDPDDADAWNLLGFSLRKSGHYPQAEAAYTRALAIDPKHIEAMEYMGELYLTLDKPEKTRALLERMSELCIFNCEDRDMLKKALDAYEAKQ